MRDRVLAAQIGARMATLERDFAVFVARVLVEALSSGSSLTSSPTNSLMGRDIRTERIGASRARAAGKDSSFSRTSSRPKRRRWKMRSAVFRLQARADGATRRHETRGEAREFEEKLDLLHER